MTVSGQNIYSARPVFARQGMVQGLALCLLMVLGAVALAGPSGLIAWAEGRHQLIERQQQIAQLITARDRLKNRVALLDPRHADPDLAGEMLRSNLNVAQPDEMVLILHH